MLEIATTLLALWIIWYLTFGAYLGLKNRGDE